MLNVIASSSSDRDEREIDEYHDKSNSNGSSESGSSESGSSNEYYSSGVLGVNLEVLQEELS